MPLIGSPNPWLVGAGVAGDQGNQLAQTLMRLPMMRQQLQQGELNNQLLQGQVQNQPQMFQGQQLLNNARVGEQNALAGANTARAGLYGSQADKVDEEAKGLEGQNASLKSLQDTLSQATQFISSGQQPPQELLAQVQKAVVGLDPKIMSKVMDSVLAARGSMNPALMNDPRMQAGAMLGDKNVAGGVNVNANAVNFPPGGGAPNIGLLRTSAGQQVADPNTGINMANNTNHNGAQSSGLAIAALRAAIADPNNVNPQQVIAAAQQYQAAMGAQQQSQQPGLPQVPVTAPQTNAIPQRKFTWTPQGLVPQQ